MATATFSAALLAGGQSRRMGRDKALLPVLGHEFLWQRQLALLDEVGPEQVLWSGHPRDGLPPGVRLVSDGVANAGPLGGLCSCLQVLKSDLLLVLAVDLPHMASPFLRTLLAECTSGCGAVPVHPNGYEPLAAIYPRQMLPLAREHLATGRLALKELVELGIRAGLLRSIDVREEDVPLFLNLNRPEDLDRPL